MQVALSPWTEAQKRRGETEAKDGKEIVKSKAKTTTADQIHKA